MNGISKGAKIKLQDIMRFNIVPLMIKTAGVVAGVWG